MWYVVKGGSFDSGQSACLATYKYSYDSKCRDAYVGFRIALSC